MSITGPDLKPWHLVLNVTSFDYDGKNPQTGTVEVWQADSRRKTSITFGKSTFTRLLAEGKVYVSPGGEAFPFTVEEALDEVLHPGPSADDLNGTRPEVRKEKFGSAQLDCIMLSQPNSGMSTAPIGLYATYCLDDQEHVRAVFNAGMQNVLLNGVGRFQNHFVSTNISLREGAVTQTEAKVTKLESYTPAEDTFTPGPEMKQQQPTTLVSGSVLGGAILSKVTPVYPENAKRNVSGTVVMCASIGSDGKIHRLR